MIKVARLFEEEKLAAVAEAVEKERKQAKQAVEKEREQAKQAVEKERVKAIIDTLLEIGYSNEKILFTLQKKLRIKEKQADEYLRKFYDKTL